MLQDQVKRINDLIEAGHINGFISDSDKVAMKPENKPGRMYGNPKCHKGVEEGKKIPPCRPIISNSGANTEKISAFVDHYCKNEVKKLDSYIADSPDLLRVFQRENDLNTQPASAFPVTVDVKALYTNTRWTRGSLNLKLT